MVILYGLFNSFRVDNLFFWGLSWRWLRYVDLLCTRFGLFVCKYWIYGIFLLKGDSRLVLDLFFTGNVDWGLWLFGNNFFTNFLNLLKIFFILIILIFRCFFSCIFLWFDWFFRALIDFLKFLVIILLIILIEFGWVYVWFIGVIINLGWLDVLDIFNIIIIAGIFHFFIRNCFDRAFNFLDLFVDLLVIIIDIFRFLFLGLFTRLSFYIFFIDDG